MYELSVLFPAISGLLPSHGWTVPTYRSADGLVIAGPHRSFPRHLFAVGLGADGLQGAFLAARTQPRHFVGAPAKGDELFGFMPVRRVTARAWSARRARPSVGTIGSPGVPT